MEIEAENPMYTTWVDLFIDTRISLSMYSLMPKDVWKNQSGTFGDT